LVKEGGLEGGGGKKRERKEVRKQVSREVWDA
jgi:hypothetical protein